MRTMMMMMRRRMRTIGRFDDNDDDDEMLRLEPSVPPGSAASFSYPQEFLQQAMFPEFAKFKAGIVNNVQKVSFARKTRCSFHQKRKKCQRSYRCWILNWKILNLRIFLRKIGIVLEKSGAKCLERKTGCQFLGVRQRSVVWGSVCEIASRGLWVCRICLLFACFGRMVVQYMILHNA